MVQTRQAFERTRSVCLTLPSRGRQGWRPALMSNVKHHEGSGDRRRVSTQLSEVVGVIETPSRTDVAGRTFVRLRSGWRPDHSDIDLLVTVTVSLMKQRGEL